MMGSNSSEKQEAARGAATSGEECDRRCRAWRGPERAGDRTEASSRWRWRWRLAKGRRRRWGLGREQSVRRLLGSQGRAAGLRGDLAGCDVGPTSPVFLLDTDFLWAFWTQKLDIFFSLFFFFGECVRSQLSFRAPTLKKKVFELLSAYYKNG